MDCPICSANMVPGFVGAVVESGHSAKLKFTSTGTGRDLRILAAGQNRESHCCTHCGSLLIVGKGAAELDDGEQISQGDLDGFLCLECRQVVPSGTGKCPCCGWVCPPKK